MNRQDERRAARRRNTLRILDHRSTNAVSEEMMARKLEEGIREFRLMLEEVEQRIEKRWL